MANTDEFAGITRTVVSERLKLKGSSSTLVKYSRTFFLFPFFYFLFSNPIQELIGPENNIVANNGWSCLYLSFQLIFGNQLKS